MARRRGFTCQNFSIMRHRGVQVAARERTHDCGMLASTMGSLLFLFYPWGIILQVVALVHFARRRPDNYWLWIIIIGGGLGALAYIAIEVLPDVVLLRGSLQVFPRRKRIKQLQALILDNPSAGNYEELGD